MENDETLYKDPLLEVRFSPRHDGYYLILGSQSIFLMNGGLEELARTAVADMKRKVTAINPLGEFILERQGVSYERLGMAIAQARNRELEQELRQAYSEQS